MSKEFNEILIEQMIFCIKKGTITIDNIVDESLREEVRKRLI